MNSSSHFVEVEGHLIRLADIVRLSEKYDMTRTKVDEVFGDEDEEEKKMKRAYRRGAGSWLEFERIETPHPDPLYDPYDDDIFESEAYDISETTFRVTLRTKWIVILRRSRPVVLYESSSYRKLKNVMDIT